MQNRPAKARRARFSLAAPSDRPPGIRPVGNQSRFGNIFFQPGKLGTAAIDAFKLRRMKRSAKQGSRRKIPVNDSQAGNGTLARFAGKKKDRCLPQQRTVAPPAKAS